MENNENKTVVEKAKKLTPTEQNTQDIKELKDTLNQILAALNANIKTETKPVEEKVEEKVENKQAEIMENTDKYKIGTNEEITFVHLIQRAPGLSTYIDLPTLHLNLTMLLRVVQFTVLTCLLMY